MMKRGSLLLAVACLGTAPFARAELSYSGRACGSGEAWDFDGALGEWAEDWRAYRLNRKPAVRVFADAWAFRRVARGAAEKAFSEYWLSRSLEELGMTHLAYAGFSALAGRAVTAQTVAVQTAALDCLTVLQERLPTLEMPAGAVANLGLFPKGDARHRAVLQELRRRVGLGRPAAEVSPLLALLENGGPYEVLGRLLASAHVGDHVKTIDGAHTFLSPSFTAPAGLERYADSARVLLGRSLFTNGKFTEAADELKRVKKSSNELARSLSDLSWAQLRDERYAEAVGTVINLQSGSLRRTFTPEAPMVLAIAFNEVCQYPESLKAVQYFRGSYASAYEWLQAWKERGGNESIYPKAVAFMKKDAEGLPDKVAAEWTRSPHFIARQDEIRHFFTEAERARVVGEQAAQMSRKMAIELLEFIKDFKPRYDAAKAEVEMRQPASVDDGEEMRELPRAIQMDIDRMRGMVTQWRRLRRAAQPWQAMVKGQEKRAPVRRKELVGEIDRELNALNLRMLLQLDEIAENLHFLEVEIYQGATQDIIWQNAHPDYKELVMTFKKESSRSSVAKNWNWGSVRGGLAGTHEVWDDELGSFKADLFDNCSSKDRYMSVKSRSAKGGN